MRCARCDRIVVPQALGRTPDGRLAFGWCLDCLDDENCLDIVITDARRRWRRRAWARRGARPDEAARRLSLAIVAAIMVLWGLAFVILAILRIATPTAQAGSPFGREMGPILLALGITLKLAALIVVLKRFGPNILRRNSEWEGARGRTPRRSQVGRGPSRS